MSANQVEPPRGQDGLSRTLYGGSHYLKRVQNIDQGFMLMLLDKLPQGASPPPGEVLHQAAPDRFLRLVERCWTQRSQKRDFGAYLRTALAREWQEFLGWFADQRSAKKAMRVAGGGRR